MEMAIPVRHEVFATNEISQLIKEFSAARLPTDASINVTVFDISYTSPRGQIKLAICCCASCAEIKTKNHTLITNGFNEFVLDGRAAPRLVVENDIYDVEGFINFLRRGFKALLRQAAEF